MKNLLTLLVLFTLIAAPAMATYDYSVLRGSWNSDSGAKIDVGQIDGNWMMYVYDASGNMIGEADIVVTMQAGNETHFHYFWNGDKISGIHVYGQGINVSATDGWRSTWRKAD
jgi:hypothetical protein